MNLTGKVALITGGGTGLGAVVARHLAREGMSLVVQYSRSRREAEDTVASLQALGVRAELEQAELRGPELATNAARLIERTVSQLGRLDLVVNNAGTTRAVPFEDLASVTLQDWDQVLDLNTKAPFFVAQAAAPYLRQNQGQIINTASISGIRARGGSSIAYSVSKAALIHLTKCLATALSPAVRVNAVAPGLMKTRWLAHFSDEQLARAAAQSPLQRTADLDDTAAVFTLLAKNASMTGQVVGVDAGNTL